MVRSASAVDLLLRDAREAAGTHNVREAVRNLTLHALRSRPLTAAHIATVALTVGKGIDSSDVPPTAPVREAHRGAWAGLEDAVGQALLAVELAAKEFAEGHACFASADRERLIAEIDELGRSLGKGWGYPGVVPPSLRERIASATAHLRQVQASAAGPSGAAGTDSVGDEALSFVASGVLVGMSQAPRGIREGKG